MLLFVACTVPYISNEKFSFLSFLSLAVPILVAINFIFLLYWVLKRRRQFWLSFLVLVLGYLALGTFVKFNFSEEDVREDDLKVLSYNVRGFNKHKEMNNPNISEDIEAFINKEKPDIICFQEFGHLGKKEYLKEDYPYQYVDYIYRYDKVLLGIFSKFPIVQQDLICFPESLNNGAYADILYKNDTIRIYNIHLQSLGITPGKGIIKREPKDKLFKMISKNFRKQQEQAKMVAEHINSNSYNQILCGDFNNNQFSNAHKTIKGDKQDTFIEKGVGYGRTLNFHGMPMRIDFILADEAFEVKSHKNYDQEYSDHFPILASFELKSD